MKQRVLACLLVVACARIVVAAQPAPATTKPKPDVLKSVTAPAGFEMTLFAQPPDVNYPTCLTATPRGECGIFFRSRNGRTSTAWRASSA